MADRPTNSLASGYAWASRATNIGIQLCVPTLLGYWADSKWGTKPWLLIAGAVLGFITLMTSIMAIANASSDDRPSARGKGDRPETKV